MNKHTPGPWKYTYNKKFDWFTIHHTRWCCNGDTSTICNICDEQEEKEANAARIVACVNACEGIDDPMELRSSVETLTSQRDELMEALDMIKRGLSSPKLSGSMLQAVIVATNAINKCKATP